jgi:hypothetical protein
MWQLRVRYYIQMTSPSDPATAPTVQETVLTGFADHTTADAAAHVLIANGVSIGSTVYPVALVGLEEN